MEPKLRVEGASKVYAGKSGAVHALEDLSLDVAEGELVTILGPSGCGKTTLLWAISGLHALTGGRIILDGTEVVDAVGDVGRGTKQPGHGRVGLEAQPLDVERVRARARHPHARRGDERLAIFRLVGDEADVVEPRPIDVGDAYSHPPLANS